MRILQKMDPRPMLPRLNRRPWGYLRARKIKFYEIDLLARPPYRWFRRTCKYRFPRGGRMLAVYLIQEPMVCFRSVSNPTHTDQYRFNSVHRTIWATLSAFGTGNESPAIRPIKKISGMPTVEARIKTSIKRRLNVARITFTALSKKKNPTSTVHRPKNVNVHENKYMPKPIRRPAIRTPQMPTMPLASAMPPGFPRLRINPIARTNASPPTSGGTGMKLNIPSASDSTTTNSTEPLKVGTVLPKELGGARLPSVTTRAIMSFTMASGVFFTGFDWSKSLSLRKRTENDPQ